MSNSKFRSAVVSGGYHLLWEKVSMGSLFASFTLVTRRVYYVVVITVKKLCRSFIESDSLSDAQ